MSGNEVQGPALHILHIFSHLIFKSNQLFKVHTIISILHKRTLKIRNYEEHHKK